MFTLSALAVGFLLRPIVEPLPPAPPVAVPTSPAPPPADDTPAAVAQDGRELLIRLERAVGAIAALDPAALRQVVDEAKRLPADRSARWTPAMPNLVLMIGPGDQSGRPDVGSGPGRGAALLAFGRPTIVGGPVLAAVPP